MTADERARRILAAVAAIPAGRVASYGEVAALAGLPRRARLVGQVLRHAPAADGLPWHRVVNARGAVALPPGDPARAEQLRRLRAEGIRVSAAGRVSPGCRWRPATLLDEVLWGPLSGGRGAGR